MVWKRFARSMRRLARPFLTRAQKNAITHAIKRAESKTTGQIHVHVVGALGGREPLEAAREVFARLGMEKTRARNAVLILVSDLDQRFAIWGDEGIHAKAGQKLWDGAARALVEGLRAGQPADALIACVERVGAELAEHFPRREGDDDSNELPDEVTSD